jgi:hypothetical protein
VAAFAQPRCGDPITPYTAASQGKLFPSVGYLIRGGELAAVHLLNVELQIVDLLARQGILRIGGSLREKQLPDHILAIRGQLPHDM